MSNLDRVVAGAVLSVDVGAILLQSDVKNSSIEVGNDRRSEAQDTSVLSFGQSASSSFMFRQTISDGFDPQTSTMYTEVRALLTPSKSGQTEVRKTPTRRKGRKKSVRASQRKTIPTREQVKIQEPANKDRKEDGPEVLQSIITNSSSSSPSVQEKFCKGSDTQEHKPSKIILKTGSPHAENHRARVSSSFSNSMTCLDQEHDMDEDLSKAILLNLLSMQGMKAPEKEIDMAVGMKEASKFNDRKSVSGLTDPFDQVSEIGSEVCSELSFTSAKNEKLRFRPSVQEDMSSSRETEEKEIELVMSQASCGRSDAIDALKLNGNDIVEAILFCEQKSQTVLSVDVETILLQSDVKNDSIEYGNDRRSEAQDTSRFSFGQSASSFNFGPANPDGFDPEVGALLTPCQSRQTEAKKTPTRRKGRKKSVHTSQRSIVHTREQVKVQEPSNDNRKEDGPEVLQSIITNSSSSSPSVQEKFSKENGSQQHKPTKNSCNAEKWDAFSFDSSSCHTPSTAPSMPATQWGNFIKMFDTDLDDATKLRFAVLGGRLDFLQELLDKQDFDADEAEVDGVPMFIAACGAGHVEIVKTLLKQMDVSRIWSGSIPSGIRFNDVRALKVVVGRQRIQRNVQSNLVFARLDRSALNVILNFLLPRITDVNKSDADGVTGLFISCARGHLDVVNYLLTHHRLDVNAMRNDDVSPLYMACANGHRRVAESLLGHPQILVDHGDHNGLIATFSESQQHIGNVENLDLRSETCVLSSLKSWRSGGNQANDKAYWASLQSLQESFVSSDCPLALVRACEFGSVEVVRQFLRRPNINLNQKLMNRSGPSLLHIACNKKHTELVKEFLSHQHILVNQPTTDGQTPLFVAAGKGHIEIVQQLLSCEKIEINKTDREDRTPLYIASERGHEEIAEQLLSCKEIEINKAVRVGWTPLYVASHYGHLEIVQQLLSRREIEINKADNESRTPLSAASYQGHLKIVEQLLSCKEIEINKADNESLTPLCAASGKGHLEIVKLLLSCKEIEINKASDTGRTPLSAAYYKGHLEIVKLLLSCKEIEINKAGNESWTPLYDACYEGHLKIVEQLLSCKEIEINKAIDTGWTPLHAASYKGHLEVVEKLLSRKEIEIYHRNSSGLTAMSSAVKQGHTDIVNLFRDYLSKNFDPRTSTMYPEVRARLIS